jgi:hypothetical protein
MVPVTTAFHSQVAFTLFYNPARGRHSTRLTFLSLHRLMLFKSALAPSL